jgi:PST family polysaccharide transporter
MVQHQALLTRQLKLGHTSTIRLVTSLLSTVLAVALAWMDLGYWALIWREVARSAMLAGGMWICCPWIPSLPSMKTDIRAQLKFGAHLTGANILSTLCGGCDRFLLGRYWGAVPVAIFRQANQLISAPTDQLLSPLYQVTQPGLSMLQSDPVRYQRFYRKVLSLVCIITMPLSLFVAVYAVEITLGLLGGKWIDTAPILMIISYGTFIKQAVGSTAFIPISRGHSQTYLFLTVLQNVTWLIFVCIGAWWGTKGLALADVAATYILIAPRLHYSLKGSPVTIGMFFSAIARPATASVAMWIALNVVRAVFPIHAPPLALGLGCLIALVVFPVIWLLMPGGKTELIALISDLRAAVQGKVTRIETTEPVAIAG